MSNKKKRYVLSTLIAVTLLGGIMPTVTHVAAEDKTVITADNYVDDNPATKLETVLGTPIQIVSGDFEGPKVTTNGNAREKTGNYKKENIAVNVADGKLEIGMDTALTGMSKFQTKIEAITDYDPSDGYAQSVASNNGFVSHWYANADGSLGDNVSATLRADKDSKHQGVVISEMKGYMPNRTASYNLGYMELTSVKDDGSGENKS